MKAYVLIFGIVALVALCFTDPGIQPAIKKAGRWTLLISGTLFVISGAIALLS